MHLRLVFGALIALGIITLAPYASAHGAFPAVRQLAADPSDPSRIFARATHGVLSSDDHGQSWRWVCTTAAGYGSTEQPALAVSGSGSLLLGAFDGLLTSPDRSCTWAPNPSLSRTVTGLAVDAKDPNRVVVLMSSSASSGGFDSELWQSSNAGASYQSVPGPLDATTLFTGVGIAASDPTRIYLSGLQGSKNVVFASDDSGATWAPAVVVPVTPGSTSEIAGVHPNDPDRVYVRAGHAKTQSSEGALLVSHDGAKTFTEVMKHQAPLLGFALSPDGDRVFVGYGDPHGGVTLDQAALGLYSADSDQNVFSRVHPGPVACVTFVGPELWACTSQADHGFEIGRSDDGGVSFTPVMKLSDLAGPLECPAASTVAMTCSAEDWKDVCIDTGKCGDSAPLDDDSGCGCRSASGTSSAGLVASLVVAALALGRRRLR